MRTLLRAVTVMAATVVLLSGCDKQPAQQSTTADEESEGDVVGRWTVVPAPGGPLKQGDALLYFGWRIDTVTGGLEMCTFDVGGQTVASAPGAATPPTLTCTAQVAAPSD